MAVCHFEDPLNDVSDIPCPAQLESAQAEGSQPSAI